MVPSANDRRRGRGGQCRKGVLLSTGRADAATSRPSPSRKCGRCTDGPYRHCDEKPGAGQDSPRNCGWLLILRLSDASLNQGSGLVKVLTSQQSKRNSCAVPRAPPGRIRLQDSTTQHSRGSTPTRCAARGIAWAGRGVCARRRRAPSPSGRPRRSTSGRRARQRRCRPRPFDLMRNPRPRMPAPTGEHRRDW